MPQPSEQDTPYFRFCREERNLAALLYHHWLASPKNLEAFIRLVDAGLQGDPAECEVYYEFAMLRDLWDRMEDAEVLSALKPTQGLDRRKAFVLGLLPDRLRSRVADLEPGPWNSFFQVAGKRSVHHVQSPARWSPAEVEGVTDEERKTLLQIKWSFNLKPDLVIRTPEGTVICVEAKVGSGESSYVARLPGGERYALRQRACQAFMFKTLLMVPEARYRSVLLVRKRSAKGGDIQITWQDAFAAMPTRGGHPFVQRWLDENTVYRPQGAR